MVQRNVYEAPYLDEEEREAMEAIDHAIDRGQIPLQNEEERLQLNERWQKVVQEKRERAHLSQLSDI